ncbi:hypothetical protein PDESU_00408 [Pontiella desulfatans]|uniref:Uncharacterized protein n=1 Tax=Pontiella desulfatans TaxID=2750659 RepID=A0A6C2TX11_PONDE|nr:hypothetical protein [Pontiella desulfatans]VGO11861.1 hypothetical protein PDESU_00408 [Pontiella desulfatans]
MHLAKYVFFILVVGMSVCAQPFTNSSWLAQDSYVSTNGFSVPVQEPKLSLNSFDKYDQMVNWEPIVIDTTTVYTNSFNSEVQQFWGANCAYAGQMVQQGDSWDIYGSNTAFIGTVRPEGNSMAVYGSQTQYKGRFIQEGDTAVFYDQSNLQQLRAVEKGDTTYFYNYQNMMIGRAVKQGNTVYYYDSMNTMIGSKVSQ